MIHRRTTKIYREYYPVKTLTITKESVSLIFRKPNCFAHVVKMERGLGGVCDGAGSIKKCRCDSLFNKIFICLGFQAMSHNSHMFTHRV